MNVQQDPYGNFLARFVFPEPVTELKIEVDLVADMTVYNPFDFFVEPSAETWPFDYPEEIRDDLAIYVKPEPAGPLLAAFLATIDRSPTNTVNFIVDLNARIQREIGYIIRMETGVQTPEDTLACAKGSCRDSSWLLVQVLRNLGLAARFVSGYLIQLKPDLVALDGPPGTSVDFTDLHAWCEVYLPGAGWIGLDPTSGLLTGESHVPLAATPHFRNAAPISGMASFANVDFGFDMRVDRVAEHPRITKPFSDESWAALDALGNEVDRVLKRRGRPPHHGRRADLRVDRRFRGGRMEHRRRRPDQARKGRRADPPAARALRAGRLPALRPGQVVSGQIAAALDLLALLAQRRRAGLERSVADRRRRGATARSDPRMRATLLQAIADGLGVAADMVAEAYEDPAEWLLQGRQASRQCRSVELQAGGSGGTQPHGACLRARPDQADRLRAAGPALERGRLRPALALGKVEDAARQAVPGAGRFAGRLPPAARLAALCSAGAVSLYRAGRSVGAARAAAGARQILPEPAAPDATPPNASSGDGLLHRRRPAQQDRVEQELGEIGGAVRTAISVEPRDGRLCVFMPPVEALEDYLELIAAAEKAAQAIGLPVHIEGYGAAARSAPQRHPRRARSRASSRSTSIRPSNWQDCVATTTAIYEEARQSRLGADKFMIDGRHTGTGGGNHVVVGGATPNDSPFLRRPDLLKSLVLHWQRHPSLSYLFSGLFIGPTSQAPRFDEARHDSLYELEIALAQVPRPGEGTAAAALAGRPPVPQPARRRHRQHAPLRNLHRQAVLAGRPDRPARPRRVPRLRDAAQCAHEPRPAVAGARADRPVLEEPARRPLRALGHRAARPLHAAALRLAGFPRRARRPRPATASRSGRNGSPRSSNSASRSAARSSMRASSWSCARRWSHGT